MESTPRKVARGRFFFQLCMWQWDPASFVHQFWGPNNGLDMSDAGQWPFLNPGQDGPQFRIRATNIAPTFIIIVLFCRLVLTPHHHNWAGKIACLHHFCLHGGWGRDIVDQHMMNMEQGELMGRGKLLMTANHSIPSWFGREFFCGWSKKNQFLPRPTGPREHGSEYSHKKQDRSCSEQ